MTPQKQPEQSETGTVGPQFVFCVRNKGRAVREDGTDTSGSTAGKQHHFMHNNTQMCTNNTAFNEKNLEYVNTASTTYCPAAAFLTANLQMTHSSTL